MPTYVYYCPKCGLRREQSRTMANRDKRLYCTKCRALLTRSYEGLRFNLRKNPPINQHMSESDIENLNANKRG